MLRDISDWEYIGHGGKSTLEKEELLSPNKLKYLIKYPREVEVGVSWEDITEMIAAKVGVILGLDMMKVEIVTRSGRRGCLLRNFVEDYNATMYEEGGALLSGLVDGYNKLQQSSLKGKELIDAGFKMISKFDYWESIKVQFIDMLVFDVLIGNQDRHPYNWIVLFFDNGVKFSPIYDNGASLGFRFDDRKLEEMTTNVTKLNKYVRNTKVKAGLFERKHVKAKELLTYLQIHFPDEFGKSVIKLKNFDLNSYYQYIQSLRILSTAQKSWLQLIIPYRRNKILDWVGKEEF